MIIELKVGDIAYPPYCPTQAGVIVKVEHREGHNAAFPVVTIRMLNGREVETTMPSDFIALADEHRRKADKFQTLATSLATMAVAEGYRMAR